jgi:hypothetical protein
MANKDPANDNHRSGNGKKVIRTRSGTVDTHVRFQRFAAWMEAQASNAKTPDKGHEFASRVKLFRLLANGPSMKGDALHRFFGRFVQRKHTQ